MLEALKSETIRLDGEESLPARLHQAERETTTSREHVNEREMLCVTHACAPPLLDPAFARPPSLAPPGTAPTRQPPWC